MACKTGCIAAEVVGAAISLLATGDAEFTCDAFRDALDGRDKVGQKKQKTSRSAGQMFTRLGK